MHTLIHADIFFFITSVFVGLLIIGFLIVLAYVILILKDMRYLSDLARQEGEKIVQDIEGFRAAAAEKGGQVRNIIDFFIGLFIRRHNNKKNK